MTTSVSYPDLHYPRYPDLSTPSHLPTPSAPPEEPETPAVNSTGNSCRICFENREAAPKGDATLPKRIAKTACGHFFHDFCLQEYLAANQNCPTCHAFIDSKSIVHLANGSDALAYAANASFKGIIAPRKSCLVYCQIRRMGSS